MNELYHHGILKQKWGVRNGPPYPLTGGAYTPSEKKALKAERKKKYSIYNKKHYDQVLDTSKTLSTLSYDKNRTSNTDMFYATYTKADKDQYNALFNKKAPQTLYNENGDAIGTGQFYKYKINNSVTKNINIASEDSGANSFIDLYSKSRDFSNFVKDSERMQSLFVQDKYKFKGYRESADALNRIRNSDTATEDDLRKAYRMFNYVLPNDTNKEVITQRARFFKNLEEKGYGAVLDTNDAIYGGFKANAPIIVFDMSSITLKNADRVSMSSHIVSQLAFAGRKALGM